MTDTNRPVCTAHEGAECSFPVTHRILDSDGAFRTYACRIAQRYVREGETAEPIAAAQAKPVLAKRAPIEGGDVSAILAGLNELRGEVPRENTKAHDIIARLMGRAMLLKAQ